MTNRPTDHRAAPLPAGWRLTASAFNWTPEVVRAERSAPDIAAAIARDGVASVIEVEAGQIWRGFPEPADDETASIRALLAESGAAVSIVGASIDDWKGPGARRSEDERLAFLLPQVRAAARLGARGIRLPLGQAGPGLLRRLLPWLHDYDIVLYEEAQGQQTPASPAHAPAFAEIAALDDPHLRLLIDLSMLMPALPVSYLELLRAGGLDAALVARLEHDWRSPETAGAVMQALRTGAVPPPLTTLFMNLVVRFGRSDVSELEAVMPLVGGAHLKFWDLDDSDERVSAPIRSFATALARSGFSGTLCSEWGGHEWLDLPAERMTREHLALAERALEAGTAAA